MKQINSAYQNVKNRIQAVPALIWLLIVIIPFGWVLIWELPQFQAEQIRQRIESREKKLVQTKELFELQNQSRENILKIIQTIGGLGFVLTGIFAWKNLKIAEKNRELAEDKQITERFSKAVELLSESEKLEARIGGIYLLERIAKDSPGDHWTVMEVLTAYIREKSPAKQLTSNIDHEEKDKEKDKPKKISADIQAALTVIGRRNVEYPEANRLNLCGVNLCGANLHGAELANSDLRNANLMSIILSEALLNSSNLSGANLNLKADLSKANLYRAVLHEADLGGAILHGTYLFRAHCSKINLRKADLSESNLFRTTLHEADLSEADFSGAMLSRADLSQAILWKSKNLTIEQVQSARNWEQAIYDDEFREKLTFHV